MKESCKKKREKKGDIFLSPASVFSKVGVWIGMGQRIHMIDGQQACMIFFIFIVIFIFLLNRHGSGVCDGVMISQLDGLIQ